MGMEPYINVINNKRIHSVVNCSSLKLNSPTYATAGHTIMVILLDVFTVFVPVDLLYSAVDNRRAG